MALSVTRLERTVIGQIGFVTQMAQKPAVPHFVLTLRKVKLNVMLECTDGYLTWACPSPLPLCPVPFLRHYPLSTFGTCYKLPHKGRDTKVDINEVT